MLKRKRTDGNGRKPQGGGKDGHLWNGCGSEAGKDERKRAAELSKRIREGSMRNQAERAEENREARAELSTGEATARRKREGLKGRAEG